MFMVVLPDHLLEREHSDELFGLGLLRATGVRWNWTPQNL
jgi:hypothetical protein